MAKWSVPGDEGRFRTVTWITVSRIPVSIALVLLITLADPSQWTVTIGLLILLTFIEVSDGLDGYLARKWGVGSEWGAMLDPYSDSVARLIVYFGLGQAGLVHPALLLVMAFRDVTVAYCRILLTQAGRSVAAMLSGKIKAVVQAVGAYAAVLSPYLLLVFPDRNPVRISSLVITLLVGAVTLWSIGQYASGALAAVRAQDEV